MAGILPDSGVPSNQALNSVDVDTVNCESGELFYSTSRCQPRFDPAAANAMISELLNVMAAAGIPYDCSKLDNLASAIAGGGCDFTDWFTVGEDPTTICEALISISNFLRDAFGDNVVILNDPVIYLRSDGSANPPIESQEDLTTANAFNSIQAILNFLDRSYVTGGRVTIDGRGVYDLAELTTLNITPEMIGGAVTLHFKGDPANSQGFIMDILTSTAKNVSGLSAMFNMNIIFEDLSFRCNGKSTGVGEVWLCRAAPGGAIRFLGGFSLLGTFTSTTGGDGSLIGFYANDGTMSFGNNQNGAVRVKSTFTGSMSSMFYIGEDATLYFSDGTWETVAFTCLVAVATIAGGRFVLTGVLGQTNTGIDISPNVILSPRAARIVQLGNLTVSRQNWIYPNITNKATLSDLFGVNTAGGSFVKAVSMDKYSFCLNGYGTDFTSDANVTVT